MSDVAQAQTSIYVSWRSWAKRYFHIGDDQLLMEHNQWVRRSYDAYMEGVQAERERCANIVTNILNPETDNHYVAGMRLWMVSAIRKED